MPYQPIDCSHVENAVLKKILLHSDMMLHDLYQIFKLPQSETESGGAGNYTIANILLCIIDGISVYLYPTSRLNNNQEGRFKQLLRKKLYWGPSNKGWIDKGIAAKQFYLELRNLLVHELGADKWTSGRIAHHSEPRIGKWGSIPEDSRDIDKIQDIRTWNDNWPILKIDTDDNGDEFVLFNGAAMWWAVKHMIIELINDKSVLIKAIALQHENDDHYIPKKNIHIDTEDFENEIRDDIKNKSIFNEGELLKLIYDKAFIRTAAPPAEPSDDSLICRYLSPLKFIQFIETRKLVFPTANLFSDRWECLVPEDYNNSALRILEENNLSGEIWNDYVKQKTSTWNVSCWTELNEDHDDHLLWYCYAEDNEGIGITIRYGQLKNHLINSVKDLDIEGQLQQGKVNYQSISALPFNKH